MKIYLSGGFRSGWQDKILAAFKSGQADTQHVKFLDPRTHGFKEADQYTAWDAEGIRQCDILFACLEQDNPSIGLACEVGLAYAMGKTIILVDMKGTEGDGKYFNMVRELAHIVVPSLEDGIECLLPFCYHMGGI